MKLEMAQFHLNEIKAQTYLDYILDKLKITVTKKANILKIKVQNKETEINLKDELQHIKKFGCAKTLQEIFDAKDRYLSTPVSIGVYTSNPKAKMQLKVLINGKQTVVTSPAFAAASEIVLAEDICFYRNECVENFNAGYNDNYRFGKFCRSYRSYLTSCISLIEVFLYRHTAEINAVLENLTIDGNDYINIESLNSPIALTKRLEAWVDAFIPADIKRDLFDSEEWSKFMELKAQRNDFIHTQSHLFVYEFVNCVKYLNFSTKGMGGLLKKMRKLAGMEEKIGFINKIVTMPEIKKCK